MPSPDDAIAAIRDQLAEYFEHLAGRVERFARAIPPEKLWVNPFPFGNSLGHLIVHLTGNLNHYIGAQIAGTGYVRNRPGEFADASRRSVDELLTSFKDAVQMVLKTLRSQDAEGLATPMTSADRPVRNRFGMFLVCASHMNNHIGQMAYLMHAHGIGSDERTW